MECAGSVADVGADSLGHIAPDVQVPVFHRRVVSVRMHPRPDPALHPLAHRPVLAVDQVPKIDRVGRVKAGLVDFMRLEQEVAGDVGAFRAARLQDECRHVIACHAQE